MTLKKDVPASFSHGAYFVYSKMLTDRKLKARGIFQENTSVFLKCSKMQPYNRDIYYKVNERGIASRHNGNAKVTIAPCNFYSVFASHVTSQ